MAHISVVIPVYKAEGSIKELYARLRENLTSITEDYEIVLVEDCGGDRSWDIIKEISAQDSRVKGLKFSRNFGQHYGITAGLDHCDGDWVVVMDCDLQDRPEEIPRLYDKAQEGYDVVLARRGKRKDPSIKRYASWFFYKVFSFLSDMDLDSEVGNFRIVSRRVVGNFRSFRERLRFFCGMVDWMGFPTAAIDVEHAERLEGKSTYTVKKLLLLAFDTIIAYSDKPLRISIIIGFMMSGVSFVYGTYVLLRALFEDIPVPGWSSLIVSLYFLSGIIIANLGIIGVYLAKTFDETKRRPLYIISKTTSNVQ